MNGPNTHGFSPGLLTAATLALATCTPTGGDSGAGTERDAAAEPSTPAPAAPGATNAPTLSLEGTYRLVARDYPDGTRLTPPAIEGLLTYTARYRNFNLVWTDEADRPFSISHMARYTLVNRTYEEQSLYHLVNDQTGGNGVTYDLSQPSGSSPVFVVNGMIEFDLPLYDEPMLRFKAGTLTATATDRFVDTWEKVE